MNHFEKDELTPTASESAPQREKIETGTEEQFKELFTRESFIDGYITQQTTPEQKVLDDLNKQMDTVLKRKMSDLINLKACEILEVESLEEGQKKGKEWGKALAAARKQMQKKGVEVSVGDAQTKLSFQEWQAKLKDEVQEEFMEEIQAAKSILSTAQQKYRETLDRIGESFMEKMRDVEFEETLSHWGESPALDKSIKHAGLVHFIEYRSDKNKDRLSKVPESFSPEGFMDYTAKVMEFVSNPNSEEIAEALRLRDEKGRERLLIMTKDNQYISAFKPREGVEWQVITHIPDVKANDWEKTKKRMADAGAQAKYHNKLEGKITKIEL